MNLYIFFNLKEKYYYHFNLLINKCFITLNYLILSENVSKNYNLIKHFLILVFLILVIDSYF